VKIVRRPLARLTNNDAWIGVNYLPPGARLRKKCANAICYARELFHFFRLCERAGIKTIYCEAIPESGIGRALMDRLRRAAQGTATSKL
jgi:L-threonylcarbamoyladenylate synthase